MTERWEQGDNEYGLGYRPITPADLATKRATSTAAGEPHTPTDQPQPTPHQ